MAEASRYGWNAVRAPSPIQTVWESPEFPNWSIYEQRRDVIEYHVWFRLRLVGVTSSMRAAVNLVEPEAGR